MRPAAAGALALGLTVLAACEQGAGGSGVGPAAPEPATAADAAAPAAALPAPAGAVASLPVPEGVPAPAPDAADALPVPQGAGVPPDPVAAPEVYMALQSDSAGLVSVVFAIDEARDGTPSDDPAIRLSPEAGDCNPQPLPRFGFPADAQPIFDATVAARPVTARMMPDFMAVTVTEAMIARGFAGGREQTRAQNICTRKLWEGIVAGDLGPALATAGQ